MNLPIGVSVAETAAEESGYSIPRPMASSTLRWIPFRAGRARPFSRPEKSMAHNLEYGDRNSRALPGNRGNRYSILPLIRQGAPGCYC